MIRINYNRLFNLVVAHGYFKDGHDQFASLIPTEETRSLLKKGKMLFKHLPHGVTVLYQAADDEITPFVDMGDNLRLVFKLEIKDIVSFLNITDLDESTIKEYKSGNILYFTNDPSNPSSNKNQPEDLEMELLDNLRGQLFTFNYTVDSNPASSFLTVRDRDGTAVSIGTDTEGNPLPVPMPVDIQSNGTYSQQIDLRDSEKGKYTITVANNDGSTVFLEEEIYADSALEGEKLTGIVVIEYNDTTNEVYGATEEYRISFQRLTSTWKYFIVNKSGNLDYSADTISINDAGSVNGSPYETNTFTRAYASILLTADAAGPGGNSITLSYSGTGNPPAVLLSGPSLSGGEGTTAATAVLTIINNDLDAYTISIGGVDFEEGDQFSKGATAAETASNLISAINADLSVQAGASIQDYDVLINEAQTLVFASNELIPFFEAPKLNLELRNDTDVQTIVPHLSNPSPTGKLKEYDNKTESEIYVFI